MAASKGNLSEVQRLLQKRFLKKSADIKATDSNGNTSLHVASYFGHKEVVELLLQQKADIEAKNKNGKTSLYLVAENGNKEIAKLLLAHQADALAKDEHGKTPLHRAAEKGHQEVAELLLDKKADALAKDGYGMSPLHLAAEQGHQEVADLLLERKADIEAKSKWQKGCTPLHFAVQNGHQEVVELLLAKRIDVRVKAENDRTPLHLAAATGHKNVAVLLLTNQSDPLAKDKDEKTPLDLATKNGYVEVANLLKAAIADEGSKEDPIPSTPQPFAPQETSALDSASSSSTSSTDYPSDQRQAYRKAQSLPCNINRTGRWTKRVDSLRQLNVEFFKKSTVDYLDQKEEADRNYQQMEEAIKKLLSNITQQPMPSQEVEQSYFDALKLLVLCTQRLDVTSQIAADFTKPFVAQHSADFLLDEEEVRYQSLVAQGATDLTGIDWNFSFTSDDPVDNGGGRYPYALSRDGKRIWWSPQAEIYCLRRHIDDELVDETWPTQPEEPA